MTNNKKYRATDWLLFLPALICGVAMLAVGLFGHFNPDVSWPAQQLARIIMIGVGLLLIWVFTPDKK